MDLPPINQRIKELIKEYAMENVSRFARSIGTSSQVISRLFNIDPRSRKYPEPSLNIVSAITNKYSDVSRDWLINGVGNKSKKLDVQVTAEPSIINIEIERLKWTIEQLKGALDKSEKEKRELIREASIWQFKAQSDLKP